MPALTICTIVGPVPPRALGACVDAVVAQQFRDWQMIVVDASDAGDAGQRLGRRASAEPRLRIVRCPAGASAAEVANDAVRATAGDAVALVDADGVLEPDALARVSAALEADPAIDVLYTDEDRLSARDGLVDPFFKPDWSPERMRAQDCCGHLSVVRRATFDRVGGFRPGFGTARSYDLLLRASEGAGAIHHLPAVLYHSCPDDRSAPVAAGSDHGGAAQRAVAEHMARRGVPAAVDGLAAPGRHRIRRELPRPLPTVSVVIPTVGACRPVWGLDRPLVLTAVASLLAVTTYPSIEVAVVVDPATPPAVTAALGALDVTLVPASAPFNFSRRCNEGVAATTGTVVVLLNDDVLIEQGDWLDVVVAHLVEPDVGVVGTRLRYADGRLQHAGVLLNAQALHIFNGFPDDEPGPHGLLQVDREVSAVTGACLVTRRSLFEELGGLDERLAVAFNDLDYCLRVRQAGHRIIWTPHATLYHFESQSRPRDAAQDEIDRLYERWGAELLADPYGNPNLAPKQAAWIPRWQARFDHPRRSSRVLRRLRRS